jgi:tricorn protease
MFDSFLSRGLLAVVLIWSSAAAAGAEAVPVRLAGHPALSADGRLLVFEWIGDLWICAAEGGEARRLTDHPARESLPLFTPDGGRVIYCSDRTGALQVFSIPVDGGRESQHTFHSEGNQLECLSPDGRRAVVRGARERSGYRATRLMEIDLESPRRERRLFDATAHSAAWSPDGTRMLFCQGGEVLSRKGYRGSRASRVWLHDTRDGRFEPKVMEETEVRSPLWHPDGGGIYYVSSKSGVANLWSRREGGEPVMLTHFEDDGVVHPRLSADGRVMVFRRGFDLYRFEPESGKEPVRLEIRTSEALPDHSKVRTRARGATHADFTADLQQVVFAALGELWWIRKRGAEAVRLTRTTAAESEVRFHPDGEWLYFLRDDGLRADYFRARLEDGGLADVQRVTRRARSKSRFAVSPEGSRIAWIEGNGDIFTANPDGGGVKRIFESWDRPTFDWSPCGGWLAIAAIDEHSNRDIWLARADGSRKPVNLTRHPAFEGSPRWSPDGRWLVFNGRRNPSGRLELWRMDLGKGGLKADVTDGRLHEAGEAARAIPTRGIEPRRVVWAADSKSLYFQSANESNQRLYQVRTAGGGMREAGRTRGIPIRMTSDGDLLWRVDRTPAIWRESGEVEFPVSVLLERKRRDMLQLGFRRVWRTLGERFYDPEMSGTDWAAIRAKYEPLAVDARDSRQFDRLMSQMLGELNASHLAFVRKPWPRDGERLRNDDVTAHPGLVFQDDEKPGPLVIARVVAGSPVAMLEDAPEPGEQVVRIAGREVDNRTPPHRIFNGVGTSPLPLVVRGADGAERTLELRCISYPQARLLDRKAREEARHARANHGSRIAYLPFPKMDWNAFLELEIEIYRASLDTDGMILDLRDNGGGRVTDHLLAVFCQPVHSFTIPRDGPRGYPHDRRTRVAWDKPLVVLCNENTYSNAEIFCHAMKQTGRGTLVGVATAGGVISAVSRNIPDVGRLQVPFRGWYHAQSGRDMDLNGAVPDFHVPMTPAEEASGGDPQMEKALEVLRGKIAGLPPPVEPVK